MKRYFKITIMDHNVFKILLAVTGSAGARHTLDLIKALLDINGPYKFQVSNIVRENLFPLNFFG